MDYVLIFAGLMGFSVLVYTIADGYDLGVGLLLPSLSAEQKSLALKSIGPFWDANETWLVLGVGLLLGAFPKAHSAILQALYLPILLMLIGLVLRAFFYELSLKIPKYSQVSLSLFSAGSFLASFAQGYMIAQFAAGFQAPLWFASMVGLSLCVAYLWLGALWLNATLVQKPTHLKKMVLLGMWGTGIALAAVSLTSPAFIAQVFERWFGEAIFSSDSKILYLWPYPAMTMLFMYLSWALWESHPWKAFLSAIAVFILSFFGLSYGIFPYIAPGQMTLYEAAASTTVLSTIFIGFCSIMPFIVAYTVLNHYVFLRKRALLP